MKWAAILLAVSVAPAAAQHGQHGGRPAPPRPVHADTAMHHDSVIYHNSVMHHDSVMRQQHAMVGVLGIPMSREGSGTSWVPDSTPMHMRHGQHGSWNLMLHGNVFVQSIDDGSDRGRDQFGSINWIMGMAQRRLRSGRFMLRAMLSAEPWTVGECGYPDLLATGESCDGEPLHDRQHPHDLFMELAASYQFEVSDDVAVELYGGPAAEPALGPTAYPHRTSAFPNPIAPISHHWLDATHITFGNITAGVFGRAWKVEASLFNGREPDEDRVGFDIASLNSFAGRVSLNPTPLWSLQVSAARLNDAEFPEEPGGDRVDVTRYTASAVHHRPIARRDFVAATLAVGHNIEHGTGTSAVLGEASLMLAERHIMSGRFEWVQKTGEDLGIVDADLEDDTFGVSKAAIAYTFVLPAVWGWTPGIGAGGSLSFIPDDLEAAYGESIAPGFIVFLGLRPGRMRVHADTTRADMPGNHERH